MNRILIIVQTIAQAFAVTLVPCIGNLAAQNLINNPSFEDTVKCPYDVGQIEYAKYWSNPIFYMATPDYFNICNINGFLDVPLSAFGYQYPRTGVAMGGFVSYTDSLFVPSDEQDYREFIQNKLILKLDSNKTYCGGFWINLLGDLQGTYASDGFGMTLVPDSLSDTTQVPPYNYPTWPNNTYINNTIGIVTDTLNWILVQDTFIANGTEKWAIIGNLNHCYNTDTMLMFNNGGAYAYYYIDDVFIYEVKPVFINGGNVIVVCDSVNPLTLHADNAVFYEWYLSTNPGNILSDVDSVNLSLSPGNYYLIVKGEACNYISYDSIFIEVIECIFPIIPPGFSPNGDGINDVFNIINLSNFPENSLSVINRWGDIIYHAAPYNNDWDGRCNVCLNKGGGPVTDGTYFIVFTSSPGSEPIKRSLEIRGN